MELSTAKRIKVFLKFLETFSSEKVSKPPEALAANPRKNAIASAKGLENGLKPVLFAFL